MRLLPPLLTISLCLGVSNATFAAPAARGAARPVTRDFSSSRRAIVRALSRDLGRSTTGHVKIIAWRLSALDIQAQWALASVKPLAPGQLDPVTVLLHQTRGGWKIETLGTNLHGSGAQFKAPRGLWKKWGLDGG